jgi:thiol-disulfide isomerase/thioredoxin
MKKLFLLLVIAVGCTADQEVNQRVYNFEGEEILVGNITIEGLQQAPFQEWYTYFYESTDINTRQLDLIADELQQTEIVLFLGTWCSDSQEQVPGFIRMLTYVGYDFSKMELIALERDEARVMFSPGGREKELGITYVPTFIFFQEGKEVGRIVEFPKETLERDMVDLLGGS